MADGYEKQLALCKQALEQLLEITCSWPTNTDVYKPICLAAFGSTNATLFQTIQSIARSEGFLLDPIYSAKLFQTTQALIQCKSLQGQGLLIHSGGTWSLSGFQDRFNC
jgi:1-aminocyclopropane-1-carboxylate deaminase/D-cysteine desulfhydrase-like pyridoxal-dependent ACC family enzyme